MTLLSKRYSKLVLSAGLAVFIGLFALGQLRRIWLPFWTVGTAATAVFVLVVVAGVLWRPRRFWHERGLRGAIENAIYVALGGYTFWISLGHLTEELALP